jgi:hypothetical protein
MAVVVAQYVARTAHPLTGPIDFEDATTQPLASHPHKLEVRREGEEPSVIRDRGRAEGVTREKQPFVPDPIARRDLGPTIAVQ